MVIPVWLGVFQELRPGLMRVHLLDLLLVGRWKQIGQAACHHDDMKIRGCEGFSDSCNVVGFGDTEDFVTDQYRTWPALCLLGRLGAHTPRASGYGTAADR